MPKRSYYTPDKRRLFVGQGIGPKDGPWMSFYQKYPYGGGTHRLKSPALPFQDTEAEAQDDLDKYAAAHGFKEVEGL